MKLVKVRRAGNSLAVTIPPSYGLGEGDEVIVDRLPGGELRIIPATRLHQLLREHAEILVDEDREALALLEAHDREHGVGGSAHPAA